MSAIDNGAGLEKDCKLLAAVLESMGHAPRLIAYDRPHQGLSYPGDITMFLEVMVPYMLNYSPVNYLISNPEWHEYQTIEQCLTRVSLVLCKTHDCETIWGQKLGRTYYTGWESSDFSNGSTILDREVAFLHLAGNSGTKNTRAVIDCWRMYHPAHPITIVSRDPEIRTLCTGIPNVKYEMRLADSHVAHALNSVRFHLMPSEYEGYGQGIHEALGCGGIVITTDAPPMNEFVGVPAELRIPSNGTFQRRLATAHKVSPEGVRDAVAKAVSLPKEKLMEYSLAARNGFLSERDAFRARIARLIN